MWRAVLKILFHLLPIWPLLFGLYYLTIAAVLLVAAAYIKTFKLTKQIEDQEITGISKSLEALKASRDRWRHLTFLDGLKS